MVSDISTRLEKAQDASMKNQFNAGQISSDDYQAYLAKRIAQTADPTYQVQLTNELQNLTTTSNEQQLLDEYNAGQTTAGTLEQYYQSKLANLTPDNPQYAATQAAITKWKNAANKDSYKAQEAVLKEQYNAAQDKLGPAQRLLDYNIQYLSKLSPQDPDYSATMDSIGTLQSEVQKIQQSQALLKAEAQISDQYKNANSPEALTAKAQLYAQLRDTAAAQGDTDNFYKYDQMANDTITKAQSAQITQGIQQIHEQYISGKIDGSTAQSLLEQATAMAGQYGDTGGQITAQSYWNTIQNDITRGVTYGGDNGFGKTKAGAAGDSGWFDGATNSPVLTSTGGGSAVDFNSPQAKQIATLAKQMGLDPNAVLGVASNEGLSGGVGDGGTSFGPFQLHAGGALPDSVWEKGPEYAQQWASSPEGIKYALQQMAQSGAKGLKGNAAVNAIVNNFEHPADPSGDLQAGYNAVASRAASQKPTTSAQSLADVFTQAKYLNPSQDLVAAIQDAKAQGTDFQGLVNLVRATKIGTGDGYQALKDVQQSMDKQLTQSFLQGADANGNPFTVNNYVERQLSLNQDLQSAYQQWQQLADSNPNYTIMLNGRKTKLSTQADNMTKLLEGSINPSTGKTTEGINDLVTKYQNPENLIFVRDPNNPNQILPTTRADWESAHGKLEQSTVPTENGLLIPVNQPSPEKFTSEYQDDPVLQQEALKAYAIRNKIDLSKVKSKSDLQKIQAQANQLIVQNPTDGTYQVYVPNDKKRNAVVYGPNGEQIIYNLDAANNVINTEIKAGNKSAGITETSIPTGFVPQAPAIGPDGKPIKGQMLPVVMNFGAASYNAAMAADKGGGYITGTDANGNKVQYQKVNKTGGGYFFSPVNELNPKSGLKTYGQTNLSGPLAQANDAFNKDHPNAGSQIGNGAPFNPKLASPGLSYSSGQSQIPNAAFSPNTAGLSPMMTQSPVVQPKNASAFMGGPSQLPVIAPQRAPMPVFNNPVDVLIHSITNPTTPGPKPQAQQPAPAFVPSTGTAYQSSNTNLYNAGARPANSLPVQKQPVKVQGLQGLPSIPKPQATPISNFFGGVANAAGNVAHSIGNFFGGFHF